MEDWVDLIRWPVTYRDGLPAHRRLPIQVLTGSARPAVELATCWSQVRRPNHYGLSTPGNKVAENGNKLLPKTATKSPFPATLFVAVSGNFVAVSGNNVAVFGDYSFGNWVSTFSGVSWAEDTPFAKCWDDSMAYSVHLRCSENALYKLTLYLLSCLLTMVTHPRSDAWRRQHVCCVDPDGWNIRATLVDRQTND